MAAASTDELHPIEAYFDGVHMRLWLLLDGGTVQADSFPKAGDDLAIFEGQDVLFLCLLSAGAMGASAGVRICIQAGRVRSWGQGLLGTIGRRGARHGRHHGCRPSTKSPQTNVGV